MAVVKFGALVAEARGKIGGVVFSKNSTSHYVRNLTVPVNPNTARQQGIRAAIAFLTARWGDTLTKLQQDAWALYAANVVMKNKVGEDIYLSGFNHYIRSNAIRKITARTIIDDGPVIFELPAQDPTYAITATEGAQQISSAFDVLLPWATEAAAHLFIFQGKPQNAQRNFFGGPWKGVNAVDGIDPGGAVSPDVAGSFWGIAEGQHLWNYARISRADGRLSEPFRDDTFCAV